MKSIEKESRIGTHNLLGKNNPSHKRIENGTHNFLGGEIQRDTQRKRIANRTHNFQVKGLVPALNIETEEVHKIPKELFYSRKDIYFHPKSKVFKKWKAKQ